MAWTRRWQGAVYRATDTSLSRQVAIKVLPADAFAADADADRLARFEREAKTLASLNHPHIAAIYAIEKSAGATALVMELVEGDDLDAATEIRPTWSPDGTRIAFTSNRTGPFDIYQKLTSGAGVEERVLASSQIKAPSSWSADGRFLLFNNTDLQASFDMWVVPMVGERTPSLFLKTPFRELHGEFSPDGRWVAYQSNESGRDEVFVRPFVPPTDATRAASAAPAPADGQWQASTAGGIHPVWGCDGNERYYLNPEGARMAVPMTVAGSVLEPGAPAVLFPTRTYGGGVELQGQGRQYDVAPDGRFLINTVIESAAAPIALIQHWQPGN